VSRISQQDLESLLELFDRSDWRELRVQGPGLEIFASKDPNARMSDPAGAVPRDEAQSGVAVAPAAPPAAPTTEPVDIPDSAGMLHVTASQSSPAQAHWMPVRAPCLGTFYSSPKPGSPPFVAVGQRVSATTEVCIVEVMKLFTTVRAGVAGTVRDVLVKDSELVEFDQPLILIEPDA
jgi:acetyl-CoA carboxylase biotin carboxyl carrier protein